MNSAETPYPSALREGFTPIKGWTEADRFYEHPSVESKVVRWNMITEADIVVLPCVKRLLEDLEYTYHIPTVHSQFVVTGDEKTQSAKNFNIPTERTLMIVSDRITDAVPSDTIFEGEINETMADEYDNLSLKFLRHLSDVRKNGGVFLSEYYHYSQFVYSPGAPEDSHLVLVDTEPIAPMALPEKPYRTEGSAPAGLFIPLAYICKDILRLEEKTGRVSDSRFKLREFVEQIDSAGFEEIEMAKEVIRVGLERNDSSVLDFILERGFEDPIFGSEVVDSTSPLAEYIHRQRDTDY